MKTASEVTGTLTLTDEAIKLLGGLDKAQKLLNSGKFEVAFDGILKQWKVNFYGNQWVAAKFVEQGKAAFTAKAASGMKILKVIKTGGVIFSVASVALPIIDMIRNKPNGDNGTDLAAAGLGVLIPGGWIACPLLWILKKVDNTFFKPVFDEMQHDRFKDSPITKSTNNLL